jgi:hypothetical protein
MKKTESKKSSLRLTLNRETLRTLDTSAFDKVVGGIRTYDIWCNTNTTCGSWAC